MAATATAKKRKKKSGRWRDVSYHRDLAKRMRTASEGFVLAEIGDLTGYHPENVRRYMVHGRVPAHFLANFAEEFEVSPRWLLFGKGQMRGK